MIRVRIYNKSDIKEMTEIWNEVVKEGNSFPQENTLSIEEAEKFFGSQTVCGVAELHNKIVGLYILHPNNVGRCGHICNASYGVKSQLRGMHIGENLVKHCLKTAKENGFKILQFNAVVKTNKAARHLYEKLGFIQLGTIPKGFKMIDGTYEDICPYYKEL